METKNLFGEWAETQNKMVANWMESVKNFQGAAKEGEVLTKGVELYKEWFDGQKTVAEELFSKSEKDITATMPEFAQEWAKQQKQFTEKWTEMMKASTKDVPFNSETMLKDVQKNYDNLIGAYNQWFSKNSQANPYMPGTMAQDGFGNAMNASKAYMQMFEFWQPFYKMLSDNKMNFENLKFDDYSKMFNSEKYTETIQSMFGFMSADQSKNYFEQISNSMNTFRDSLRNTPFGGGDASMSFSKFIPNFAQKDFNAFSQMQEKMNEGLGKMLEPFTKMIPPSNTKEYTDNMTFVQQNLAAYQMKYAEMQHIMSATSQKAVETTVKHLFEQAKEGKSVESYSEFFNYWLGTLEKEMITLFESGNFSKLQGELLSLSLGIKQAAEKNMEASFAGYPVALRSESDALAKQLHDLKARVKQLEKSLGGTPEEGEEDTTAKKGGRKSTTK